MIGAQHQFKEYVYVSTGWISSPANNLNKKSSTKSSKPNISKHIRYINWRRTNRNKPTKHHLLLMKLSKLLRLPSTTVAVFESTKTLGFEKRHSSETPGDRSYPPKKDWFLWISQQAGKLENRRLKFVPAGKGYVILPRRVYKRLQLLKHTSNWLLKCEKKNVHAAQALERRSSSTVFCCYNAGHARNMTV